MLYKNNFSRIYPNKPNGCITLTARKYASALLPASFISACLLLFALAITVSGNDGNKNSADMTLRSSGRVNPSTLGMEMDIPLGGFSGRGISIPINLSYSSKLWRLKYGGIHAEPGQGEPGGCAANYEPYFSEESAAGWTTSMATPYIEYTGSMTKYSYDGEPDSGSSEDCVTLEGGGGGGYYYVKRITVHLPGGETHELRADDSAFIEDGNNPHNLNGVYYAVDGSNLKYIQDPTTNPPTSRLQMPDGSFYDFAFTPYHLNRLEAVKFTDRNGNFTSYFAPGSVDDQGVTHPNGYWKDTLGRNISVPIGLKAPTAPTTAPSPQIYKMPGMTGEYKLHWKKLNGGTQAESALTDITNPNYQLRYTGDTYLCSVNGIEKYCYRPSGSYLFSADGRVNGDYLFNPVVLSEIELPTGQKYKFTYDVYGRIEKIIYPTGGVETFEYGVVPPLSKIDDTDPNKYANFGVKKRRVYQTAGQGTPYEWTYESFYTEPSAYVVRTTNPDNTKSERYLHRGNSDAVLIRFGYESVLAGMPYEERGFDKTGTLVSKKLTYWTKSVYPVNPGGRMIAERQPRVAQEKSFLYDSAGNGVSATVIYEYEGNINTDKTTPVLLKKSTQYAFETDSGGNAINMSSSTCDPEEEFCEPPLPTPSPSPTPLPIPSSSPVRISETTYLINDAIYPEWVKDIYKAQNMIGLATASVIKDGAGTIVSRSEMKYDDGSSSPNIGRGNPTSLRVWDNMRGNWDDPDAYITTYAKFDQWGNQYETTDAKGNSTVTEYDTTHRTYPLKVTSTIPDPSGANGSNTAFETTATFDPITGLPLTTTDANGQTTTMQYDPATLRPIRVIPPAGAGIAETIYHDEAGNYWVKNRVQIDTDKWAESITYFDGLGRAYKAEEINSEGNIFVEKEFDAEGRVKRVTNPFRLNETKQWTTNVYDNASRIKEVHLSDGAKVITDYGVSVSGVVGVTKQITDQAGKKRKGFSDALGRMIRVIEDPDNSNLNTDYVFDTLGNLRKTIQGEQSRYFTFDSLGRLLYAKQPEQEANTSFSFTDAITNNSQWSVKYQYDDNGNITQTIDARGVSVTGTYDKFNRLIFRDYSDATPDVSFFYDGTGLGSIPAFSKGKTTKVTSSVSETRYTSFNNLGRLLTHQQITDGQTYDTSYQYNLSGALEQETYPSGRTFSYNLDEDGDLESVWGQKPNSSAKLYLNQIKYNSAGAIERMRLGNGRWESAVYNTRGQITQIGLGYSDTDKSLINLDYDYGTNTQNNGSLRQQKINYRGLANQITQDYTYDDLNRLKSSIETVTGNANPVWKQTFNYDRYGNRTFDAANTTTLNPTASWKMTNPLINTGDNRLKKDQDGDNLADYDYDKAGNLTIDAENQRFVFDAENRMKEFFHSSNTTQTPDAVYSYDGEGRRVKKVSGNQIVIFVYNSSGSLVAEYDSQLAANPQVSYLTADHLGSPRVITDGRGAVISRHDYMAFGQDITQEIGNVGGRTTAQGFNSADEVRKQYTGYERDDESGLDYAQARYYNSNHGRFTSVDPLTASASISDPQTFNRYSYVLNSPYKFVDPLGLISEFAGSACGNRCANSDYGPSGGSGYQDVSSNFLSEPQTNKSATSQSKKQRQDDCGKKGKKGKDRGGKTASKSKKPVQATASDPLEVFPSAVPVGEARINELAEKVAKELNEGLAREREIIRKHTEAYTDALPDALGPPAREGDMDKNVSRVNETFKDITVLMVENGAIIDIPTNNLDKAFAIGGDPYSDLSGLSSEVRNNRIATEEKVNAIIRAANIDMQNFHTKNGGTIDAVDRRRALSTGALKGVQMFKKTF